MRDRWEGCRERTRERRERGGDRAEETEWVRETEEGHRETDKGVEGKRETERDTHTHSSCRSLHTYTHSHFLPI